MISTNTTSLRGVFLCVMLSLFLMATFSNGYAQEKGPSFESLQEQVKNEYFSIGALLQTVGEYQYDRRLGDAGNNGFSIANARMQVYGEIDQSFGYQLQANFIKSPSLLDANMYYRITPDLSVKAGLFKSPFSYEFLTGAAAIDFVNRSTVVNQLAPNRQVGMQLGGNVSDGKLRYKLGVFNGNGLGINQNSDHHYLYVGRMESHIAIGQEESNKIIFGINASYEQKGQPSPSGNLRSTFEGEQTLMGSDLRFRYQGLTMSGEFIYSRLVSDSGIESNPFGYHATAGYYVAPKTQVLLRWDRFEGDNMVRDEESFIAGLNYFPTSYSEIQLNYILPSDRELEFSQLLLNLQINF